MQVRRPVDTGFKSGDHSRQAKKNITDNQRFILVSIFEDFIFKSISFTFSTCLALKISYFKSLA